MALSSRVLSDGDDRFLRMNARLRPSQLKNGEVALSENGRMDVDGVWKVRDGYENISGVVLTTTNTVILRAADTDAAVFLMAATGIVDTAALVSGVCTVTTTDPHGLPSGHTVLVNLDGFDALGSGPIITGNRIVTRTGASTFTFSISGADDTYANGTTRPAVLDSEAVAIRGSCLYSDASADNDEYIILADNTQATAVKLSTLAKTNISYPTSEVLSQDADLLQEFGKVVLRQKGKTAWTWDGDLSGGLAFTKVDSGTKLQHKIFDATGNTSFTKGLAKVTTAEAHGLSVGDSVLVVDSEDYDFLDGTKVVVSAVPSTTTWNYYADSKTDATTTIVYSTSASLGGGYINQPGGAGTDLAAAIYHQRRVWMNYAYTDAATPVARNISDELIASDILDGTTFDPIGNQFRITAGTADFMVAIHGFDDDRLLVFMRNSIHYLKGVSGSLNDVETIQLSSEIGCIARKSVANFGSQILYLSDEGVYSVAFLDEFNLRGTDLPLSEAIDPLIKRITKGSADKAIGRIHDNKYWLAVPIDGSTENNAILIYSFLNGGWESIDTTNASNWEIIDLIPARAGKVNELYAITNTGGIHKLDGAMREKDKIAASAGQSAESILDIPAALTTRQYAFNSIQRKKFNRMLVHLDSDESYASDGTMTVEVEDIDTTVDLGELNAVFTGGLAADESGTVRLRLGNPRGFAAHFKFTVTDGKPAVRAVQMDAVPSFNSTTSVT
jgi:hypothetical protein